MNEDKRDYKNNEGSEEIFVKIIPTPFSFYLTLGLEDISSI